MKSFTYITTLASILLFSSLAQANFIQHNFPKISIADALDSTDISIENFCMSADGSTLKSINPIVLTCGTVEHLGRGYKKCSPSQPQHFEVENAYTVSKCIMPGCSQRTLIKKSYAKTQRISVTNMDPRSGIKVEIDSYDYEIPTCEE